MNRKRRKGEREREREEKEWNNLRRRQVLDVCIPTRTGPRSARTQGPFSTGQLAAISSFFDGGRCARRGMQARDNQDYTRRIP